MWPFKKKVVPDGRRDNRWTGGEVNLVLPPLPPKDVGIYGARFYLNQFQEHSGVETYLCIFEEPKWARQYGRIKRLDLVVSNMAIRTESGPIAISLWHLLDAGQSLCVYEHFFDPLSVPTLQWLKEIQEQSRLKLVMLDNRSGETCGFWEFDNNFKMGDFATSLAVAVLGNKAGPFDDRVAEVKREYTTEQLMGMKR